jgi:N-acetylglucosaminyl-diphospho-decaprenol L-rhamnosyltransferase
VSTVSIVIVSYNASNHLRRCLTSLRANLGGSFETVVVDNASPDASADMVEREFPGIRLIKNRRNAGFSAGANLGAGTATGDVIVFLNPDCELDSDPFSAPADYLRANPDAGVLGIKVLDPDGGLQLSVRRFPGLAAALFNRYSLLSRVFPNNPFSRRYLMTDWDHDSISTVDWVSGACLMTTPRTLDRVGGLDEAYFWGFEDVDFCQRAHRAGLRVVYFPDASVKHEIGASARTVPTRALFARHGGMWRYYRTYLSKGPVVDVFVFAGVWARFGLQLLISRLRAHRAFPSKS